MKRPAVFFDRDNTLIASDGYLGDPAKVVLIPGAADAIARVRGLGYAVVVFSNQSGVARGMFTEEDVQAVNARMAELLLAENGAAVIDRHEFCPFHPAGTVDVYARESDRRKPKPGMIHAAASKLALDLPRSWVVGDAGRDVEAGKAAGCRAILFNDPSLPKSPAAEAAPRVAPEYVAGTLADAAAFIERNPDPDLAIVSSEPVASATVTEASQAEETGTAAAEPVAVAVQPAADAPTVTAGDAPPADAPPPGKRVPKVAIGSRYVPPEGTAAAAGSSMSWMRTGNGSHGEGDAAAVTETERPAYRKPQRTAEDEAARALADLPGTPTQRSEELLEQIFLELRRQHEQQEADFSVSKLFAGVVQVLALATLFLAYLKKADTGTLHTYLQLAIMLQTLTIALLIMSRQK